MEANLVTQLQLLRGRVESIRSNGIEKLTFKQISTLDNLEAILVRGIVIVEKLYETLAIADKSIGEIESRFVQPN